MTKARLAWALAIVLTMVSAVTALVLRSTDDRQDRQAEKEAVLAYEKAVTQPAKDGGFVVQNGMKPAVAALGRNEGSATVFQAVGWVQELERVRGAFAAVVPPPSLRVAAAEFDAALLRYKEAAETLGAAAIATGDARRTLLDRAVATAREGDAAYDRASRVLQLRRVALGLGVTTAFPNPDAP